MGRTDASGTTGEVRFTVDESICILVGQSWSSRAEASLDEEEHRSGVIQSSTCYTARVR